jgi:addiction module RelE/StbE family toxin
LAVIWTERAREDLIEIFRYIAQDNRHAAARWVGRLIERAEGAAEAPLAGRVVPEVQREDVREVLLKSYRVIYRVAGEDLRVLTVFEGHRRIRHADLDDTTE